MTRGAEVHVPTYEGTTTDEWRPPAGGAADALAGHYLLSTSGFPPAERSDLALAVVDAEGRLHRSALIRARSECRQRPELTVSVSSRGIAVTSTLLRSEFDETGPAALDRDDAPTEAERTLDGLTIPGRTGGEGHGPDEDDHRPDRPDRV